ncbi:unnamed protein product [Urochloa humidicola]
MARMASAAKLRARSAAQATAVALLVATCLLVLAATVADAGRPLKEEPAPSSDGDNAVRTVVVVEATAGDIQTVVGAAEHDGAGNRDDGRAFMSIHMLGGIKDSGPSPGDGH